MLRVCVCVYARARRQVACRCHDPAEQDRLEDQLGGPEPHLDVAVDYREGKERERREAVGVQRDGGVGHGAAACCCSRYRRV